MLGRMYIMNSDSNKMLLKVLSIDLDYLTNNLRVENGNIIIEDEFKFRFIKKLIHLYKERQNTVYPTSPDIRIIEDHGDAANIVKQLVEEKDILGKDTVFDPIHIVNIDHHHDIYYHEAERRDILRESHYNHKIIPEYSLESDWIWWLMNNYHVVQVDEILNENSKVSNDMLQYGISFHFKLGSPFNPYDIVSPYGDNVFAEVFDVCIIAKSPSYTTPDTLQFVMNYLGLEDGGDK